MSLLKNVFQKRLAVTKLPLGAPERKLNDNALVATPAACIVMTESSPLIEQILYSNDEETHESNTRNMKFGPERGNADLIQRRSMLE